MNPTIATRADLDACRGTAAYDQFLTYLRGTLSRRTNTQTYPDQYDSSLQPGAAGYLPPIWVDVPDPSTAARFGFTPEQLALSS